MARDLFRVTVDEYNYSNLLARAKGVQVPEPIALTDQEIEDALPDEVEVPDELRIWAINADSPAASEYDNYMAPGDGLLFWKVERGRAPDEKRYVGVGEIGTRFETDERTARRLFQTPRARHMFTVSSFTAIEKTPDAVQPILGYMQHPRRTQRVKPDRYASVTSALAELRQ